MRCLIFLSEEIVSIFFFSNIPQNSSDTQIAIIFVINSFYMAYENRSRDNKRESSAFMEKSWALNNFAFF